KLGTCYANGDGVPQDLTEAATWLRRAAEQGVAEAQYHLGFMYDQLGQIEKNPRNESNFEAVEGYWKAAHQDHPRAQLNLGLMFRDGRGVSADAAQAVSWLRKAAGENLVQAQAALGAIYANGRGVPQDDGEAVTWYRLAAEQGHADAQYN